MLIHIPNGLAAPAILDWGIPKNGRIEAPADTLRLKPGRRSVQNTPAKTALPAATETDAA